MTVENRAGAGGILGADAAAKSAPDGYTWLLSSGSGMSIVPLLKNKMPFDPTRDLIPVAGGARLELFLVARADLPFTSFPEFLRHVRANQGKADLRYTRQRHVAPRGRLDYTFDPGVAVPHVRSGKLRMMAVGSMKRSPLFPDTPTLNELGLKGFDAGTTHGFWAPAGTLAPMIERVNAEINRALAMPDVAAAIRGLGAVPHVLTPAAIGKVIADDRNRYAVIVKERNITQD